jgi:hypothetical protein
MPAYGSVLERGAHSLRSKPIPGRVWAPDSHNRLRADASTRWYAEATHIVASHRLSHTKAHVFKALSASISALKM